VEALDGEDGNSYLDQDEYDAIFHYSGASFHFQTNHFHYKTEEQLESGSALRD
jgi:hypothetical protein